MATISVIMGVYNPSKQKRFLQSVESIVRQTVSDWELILYDDGSDPGYRPLFRQAAAMDARIRLLHGRVNRGLGYALNAALRRSSGVYIARMDADDRSKPDRFARQLAFLQGHPQYQWVGSIAELADQTGVWGLQTLPEQPENRDFLSHSPYIHPSVLFRREVLWENGGYRSGREYLQCEDYELFLRLHARGYRGYNLQTPLLEYWEDRQSYRRRGYSRRVREMKLRLGGFRRLQMLRPATLPYVVKPLLLGLLPGSLLHGIRLLRVQRERGKPNRYDAG